MWYWVCLCSVFLCLYWAHHFAARPVQCGWSLGLVLLYGTRISAVPKNQKAFGTLWHLLKWLSVTCISATVYLHKCKPLTLIQVTSLTAVMSKLAFSFISNFLECGHKPRFKLSNWLFMFHSHTFHINNYFMRFWRVCGAFHMLQTTCYKSPQSGLAFLHDLFQHCPALKLLYIPHSIMKQQCIASHYPAHITFICMQSPSCPILTHMHYMHSYKSS